MLAKTGSPWPTLPLRLGTVRIDHPQQRKEPPEKNESKHAKEGASRKTGLSLSDKQIELPQRVLNIVFL